MQYLLITISEQMKKAMRERLMKNSSKIDIDNLCSRKIWELLANNNITTISHNEKKVLEQTLISRNHYLNELYQRRRKALPPIHSSRLH